MTIAKRNEAIATAKRIVSSLDQYALIDLETTGVKAIDEAVEIAVTTVTGAELLTTILKPTVSIDPTAQRTHGIGPDQLADAPSFRDVHDKLREILSSKILIAYNAEFDKRLLANTCRAFDLKPFDNEFICAMDLRRRFNGDRPGELGGNHSAAGDCQALARLLHEIANTPMDREVPEEVTPELLVELDTLQEQIKLLERRKQAIKDALCAKLEAEGNECYQPGNGFKFRNEPRRKYELDDGVSISDIDSKYIESVLDKAAVKEAFRVGEPVKGVVEIKTNSFRLRRDRKP